MTLDPRLPDYVDRFECQTRWGFDITSEDGKLILEALTRNGGDWSQAIEFRGRKAYVVSLDIPGDITILIPYAAGEQPL